jgi:PAS domain S-box-containing protein
MHFQRGQGMKSFLAPINKGFDMARILIADDEAILTMHLEEILSMHDHDVAGSASSGQEAIDMARELSPDIIIMDISMPGEMDGIKAAEIIMSTLGIPSIFMTAHSEISIIEKARQSDPYGYLIKPVQNIGTKIVVDSALSRLYAERKLRENEQRFSDIVYSMADWVWETDEAGRYTYAAGNVKDILGYAPEELIGKAPCDLVSEETAQDLSAFFKDKASRKEAFFNKESWELSKNGNRVCVQTTGIPILNKDGSLKGYRGINKDITFTKNAAYALKEFESRFRSVMDHLNIGMTLISPDMEEISTNQTMKNWFPGHASPEKHKCYHIYRNIHQSEPCQDCKVVLTLKDGLVHENAAEVDLKTGRRYLRRISFPVICPEGNIIAAIVLIMDITEKNSPSEHQSRIS